GGVVECQEEASCGFDSTERIGDFPFADDIQSGLVNSGDGPTAGIGCEDNIIMYCGINRHAQSGC
ncbi:MAG: hypothetical protein ACOVRM_11850, partial [Planctomycetaceae bacterium]